MSNRLGGKQGTAYLGTNANQPPNWTFDSRDPNQYDAYNYSLGDLWMNTDTQDTWVLVSLAGNSMSKGMLATWAPFGFSGVTTLTGNSGGAIGPDAVGNINTLGDGTTIIIAGSPATNTLTASTGGIIATSYLTDDANTAVPAAGILTVAGAHNNNTTSAGSTVTINGNNTITLGDLTSIIGSDAITCTTGDITLSAGNINLPNTNAVGTEGLLKIGITEFLSNYGTNNQFLGGAGNRTLTTAQSNTGVGLNALKAITTANANVSLGFNSGTALTTGFFNTFAGSGAGPSVTIGARNTFLGYAAGSGIVNGEDNIFLGQSAGGSCGASATFNIMIGSSGVAGDNRIIRIGERLTGMDKCFIEGIRGITTDNNDAIPVLIDSTGQLGTVSSSIRFKDNVEELGKTSSAIYDLRPVKFVYKSDASARENYGLIAEEVAGIMPNLVINDKDGQPETVRYLDLIPMLLNEIIKLRERVKALELF